LCVNYKIENGGIIKEPAKCTKKDLLKDINQLLIHGWDSDFVTGAETSITIWARDERGNLDMFEIDPEEVDEILRGNDEFRKELRKRFKEFLKNKEIEGISISDAFMDCCYGTDEICDFEEMLGEESL